MQKKNFSRDVVDFAGRQKENSTQPRRSGLSDTFANGVTAAQWKPNQRFHHQPEKIMGAKAHAYSNDQQNLTLNSSSQTRMTSLKRICPHCHGKGTLTYHNHTEAYCGYCEGGISQ